MGRHITSSVKRTLDDVIEASATLMLDHMSIHNQPAQQRAAKNRFESLCLGYPYPFECGERPAFYNYLSESEVIQFLKYHKSEILHLCAPEHGEARKVNVIEVDEEKKNADKPESVRSRAKSFV